ncbi:hypothetical protein HZF05_18025 [Sphingomonas sp. CGMCC 1.13654]|uniref:Uncharacterized protein n=1 Tax=Sphingomonas chungangi TaxID=2683589 RepID=A0A838LAX9_9SPHN|nr:hypothetical protein [Sphingomonas chungangi]MBA2935982.1 hypothetical protein [Sphingomonas chungangi]MVW55372.1 hypothetical protein [Sphingomonas chungangi]
MYRPLILAALVMPVAAYAQPAPSAPAPRQMPTYQDDDAQWRGGTSESYGTADLHHHVDQTPAPPPVPQGYGYDPYGGPASAQPQASGPGSGPATGSNPQPAPANGWKTPKPYARQDQVDQGSPNDAAHRADRARTASLNRRPWQGYNGASMTGSSGSYAAEHAQYQAALAAHAQDMQRYQADQSDYQQHLADWRQQSDACARDAYACGGGPD